ncbi:hypothetical protein E2562_013266 [Oryza meyeriana var. granulata]|uniref:F-box/LRR-repeat protein 15/At3g58940/PEG3-like LRR domain-containing protein n=1 Tax=Oryza meyeriana var. granulata TaxID=110450 RepID=A0A6G1D426_9ORYZ|nr:hypothetical protein E2562_013266 [Oryza meyeriana var. granulata]
MEMMDRASIVAAVVDTFSSPMATFTQAAPTVVLARPVNPPHADWRGLPDDDVANILARLPVLDLFRIGYLFSPRWLDIWRARPLFLHDRQFTTPPIAADDVADAITNVLELHVAAADGDDLGVIVNQGEGGVINNDDGGDDHGGGLDVADEASEDGGVVDDDGPGVNVAIDGAAAAAPQGVVVGPGGVGADEGVISEDDIYDNASNDGIIQNGGYEIGRVHFFRVETTRWRLDHLDRWCAALQRGRAHAVYLANLAIPGHPHLPPVIRDCTSLLALHVFFFTVEVDDIDPLVRLRGLGLYGVTSEPSMIARVLHPQSEIQELIIHWTELDSIAVAATRLRYLRMYDNLVGTVAVDDAIQFRELYMYPTRPSRLTISGHNGAPSLRRIDSLDLFNTVLEIQGIVIQAGMVEQPPQMPSVRLLNLSVNYTEMRDRVPREIEQCFQFFNEPTIERMEAPVLEFHVAGGLRGLFLSPVRDSTAVQVLRLGEGTGDGVQENRVVEPK